MSDWVGAGKELVVVRCRSRWKGQLGKEIQVSEFWIDFVVALVGWVGYLAWEKVEVFCLRLGGVGMRWILKALLLTLLVFVEF